MTRHDTQTIQIAADHRRVARFLADGANLPQWAIGFAAAVRPQDDRWVVTTPAGTEMDTRLVAHEAAGTVDIVVTPAPGVTATAWTRVVPLDQGALLSFTLVQVPGTPDEAFESQVRDVTRELAAVRSALETQ